MSGIAGSWAKARRFECVRETIVGFTAAGDERIRYTYRTFCVDCVEPFETLGARFDGNDPEAFGYKLNWRCLVCREIRAESVARLLREPKATERDTRRQNRQRLIHACRDLV